MSIVKFIVGIGAALVLAFGVLAGTSNMGALDTGSGGDRDAAANRTADGDPFVAYLADDPAMNDAIRTARGTLGRFLDSPWFHTPDAMLKVAVPHDGGHEHIFMMSVTRKGDAFEGTVSNAPVYVDGLARGDRYAFTRADITDWAYMHEDRIHGGYTLRAMLPRLPEADAASLRARLAPLD